MIGSGAARAVPYPTGAGTGAMAPTDPSRFAASRRRWHRTPKVARRRSQSHNDSASVRMLDWKLYGAGG